MPYRPDYPKYSSKQFNRVAAETGLIPDSQATRAARLVLVEGLSATAAALALNVATITVTRTVKRILATQADVIKGRGVAYSDREFRADQQVLGFTNKALAAELRVPTRTVERWRTDKPPKVNPCVSKLMRIWKWLAQHDLALYEQAFVIGQSIETYEAEQFKADFQELKLSHMQLAEVLGVSVKTIEAWLDTRNGIMLFVYRLMKTLVWLKAKQPQVFDELLKI